MNNYQEALNYLIENIEMLNRHSDGSFCQPNSSKNTLQELVNKATPKKVVYKKGSDGDRWFFCPRCNEIVPRMRNFDQHTYPYCPYCGGKIDWSEYFDVD